ncbi:MULTISPECIES: hypothetical protein [Kitasatospora]|uniref:Ig-like domain-containing protein n=1 Tax=Kitasatospora setae (strain ATCC 33774 / DSM 43861 / JCM 3304 / KCC A-0304 / NBRC 14216 / KM-6054) TaxID=452652 RepID=E4NIG5_KITSK|nr:MULTISPECIES: hypothetical protein [Kitasatospora]BAJ31295.1 hypothetical protein KSE_55200 [Kitasatospora setae KM-6054]
MPRRPRRAARLAAVLPLLAAPAVLAPPAAHAEPVAMVCTGTGQQAYRPGITLTTRPTTVTNTSDLTACTGGPVGSGHHRFGPFATTASCLYTPPTGPDAFDLSWDDGTTSHYEGSYLVTTAGGQLVVTSTGTVTAGRFAGAALREVVAYLAPDLLRCATPQGVTSVSGPITIAVTG